MADIDINERYIDEGGQQLDSHNSSYEKAPSRYEMNMARMNQNVRETPMQTQLSNTVGASDYGNSVTDDKITSIAQLEDIENTRAIIEAKRREEVQNGILTGISVVLILVIVIGILRHLYMRYNRIQVTNNTEYNPKEHPTDPIAKVVSPENEKQTTEQFSANLEIYKAACQSFSRLSDPTLIALNNEFKQTQRSDAESLALKEEMAKRKLKS